MEVVAYILLSLVKYDLHYGIWKVGSFSQLTEPSFYVLIPISSTAMDLESSLSQRSFMAHVGIVSQNLLNFHDKTAVNPFKVLL